MGFSTERCCQFGGCRYLGLYTVIGRHADLQCRLHHYRLQQRKLLYA